MVRPHFHLVCRSPMLSTSRMAPEWRITMAEKTTQSYRLTSSEVPNTRRAGLYPAIIREFQEMEEESVLVSDTGKTPITLQQGLRKALETQGIDDVRMVQRGEETYLVKASRGAESSKD